MSKIIWHQIAGYPDVCIAEWRLTASRYRMTASGYRMRLFVPLVRFRTCVNPIGSHMLQHDVHGFVHVHQFGEVLITVPMHLNALQSTFITTSPNPKFRNSPGPPRFVCLNSSSVIVILFGVTGKQIEVLRFPESKRIGCMHKYTYMWSTRTLGDCESTPRRTHHLS